MQTTTSEALSEVAAVNDPQPKSESHIASASVVNTTKKQDETPKQEIDLAKVQVGITVMHKKFGQGKITSIDKARKYIQVPFSSGEKTFVMPMCFEQGFLKI